MSKYYTPSIEEFHVGFVYEEYNANNWNVMTVTKDHFHEYMGSSDFTDMLYELNEGNVRVKYLDRADIESLGWEFYPEISGGRHWRIGDNIIVFDGDSDILVGDEESVIALTVKNKSELKKLMKQLGI